MQRWIARGYKAGKVAKQSVTLGTAENPMVTQRDTCEQIGAKFDISMGLQEEAGFAKIQYVVRGRSYSITKHTRPGRILDCH